jgi:hypothetical protein
VIPGEAPIRAPGGPPATPGPLWRRPSVGSCVWLPAGMRVVWCCACSALPVGVSAWAHAPSSRTSSSRRLPQVPSHPLLVPLIGRDVHNSGLTALAVTRRPRPFRPIPRGLASGRAKVERNPAAIRPEFRGSARPHWHSARHRREPYATHSSGRCAGPTGRSSRRADVRIHPGRVEWTSFGTHRLVRRGCPGRRGPCGRRCGPAGGALMARGSIANQLLGHLDRERRPAQPPWRSCQGGPWQGACAVSARFRSSDRG